MSATTPLSGFTLVNRCGGDVLTAAATNGADENLAGDGANGNPGSSVAGLYRGVANGGGGDAFREGLAGSMEAVDAESGTQVDVFSEHDGKHSTTTSDNARPQRPRHGTGEQALGKAVPTSRSFYDASEIALRSRRLFNAYGGGGHGDGGRGSVSPRGVDIVRHSKVLLCRGRSKMAPIWLPGNIWRQKTLLDSVTFNAKFRLLLTIQDARVVDHHLG